LRVITWASVVGADYSTAAQGSAEATVCWFNDVPSNKAKASRKQAYVSRTGNPRRRGWQQVRPYSMTYSLPTTLVLVR
jgi:hypothetical protein